MSPRRLFFLAALLLAPLSPDSVRADIRPPSGSGSVPLARDGAAKVLRGESVEIRLEGSTSTTKPLKFIIRSGPKLGTLNPAVPQSTGKEQAVVRYTATPGTEGAVDTFTFATQFEGGRASDPATVTIHISDATPVLEVTPLIEAGRFLTTESVERDFSLKNSGTAPFRGTAVLPEGWVWVLPPDGAFMVPPGAEEKARVRIHRKTPGEIDERVTFRNATARFIGRTVPPVLASPSLVVLKWSAADLNRTGVLEIQNNAPEAMTATLEMPPGVTTPAPTVAVPAQESVKVPLTLAEKPEAPLDGHIRITVPGWEQNVRVEAAVAPAAVVVDGIPGEGVLDFGNVDKETVAAARREIRLRNAGGSNTTVTAAPIRFFNVEGLEENASLAPGASLTISVSPKVSTPGVNEEPWIIRYAGGEQPVTFRAEVEKDLANAEMTAAPALNRTNRVEADPLEARTEDQRKADIARNFHGITESTPNLDQNLPTVNSVQVEKQTPTTLEFAWTAPADGKWQYKVLMAQLRLMGPGRPPQKEFGEMPKFVKVTSDGTVGRAVVTGLVPRQTFRARIVAMTADGRTTLPGAELFFPAQPLDDSFPWLWAALWGFLGFALIHWWRSKRKEEALWKRM